MADASFKIEKLSTSFGLTNDNGLLTPAGLIFDNGTPSITISGSLFPLKDDPPLIRILGAASGCPPEFVILTPATFPLIN